ncbi:hypothetical protein GA0115254_120039 [Streptomyces sp. Ncost-T10-10d]|nr:hypothetical protein GA0115254_120039 [Streptomyces sp. Ncost-T10-10d]
MLRQAGWREPAIVRLTMRRGPGVADSGPTQPVDVGVVKWNGCEGRTMEGREHDTGVTWAGVRRWHVDG